MSTAHGERLLACIDEATRGVRAGRGGPFAAMVVRGEEIIATGCNEVTSACDPTAHAEVQAIRAACRALKHYQLDDCVLYSSCEPCPMCLGAIYWARPRAVYFAATRVDAAAAGFDDAFIYNELFAEGGQRKIPCLQIATPRTQEPFAAWLALSDPGHY